MKTLIVDDDHGACKVLSILISKYHPEIKEVNQVHTLQEAILFLKENSVDLVFLDVDLGGENGIDLFQEIENPSFQTIFFTAYNQYAVEAFKVNALDYLLKPIDKEDLIRAMTKVKKKLEEEHKPNYAELLSYHQSNRPKIIALPIGNGSLYVEDIDVLYLVAERTYTKVHTNSSNRPILVSKSLNKIHLLFPGKEFVRIHNSYVVNLNHIQEFHRNNGGSIIMKDQREFSISRKYKDEVIESLRLINQ